MQVPGHLRERRLLDEKTGSHSQVPAGKYEQHKAQRNGNAQRRSRGQKPYAAPPQPGKRSPKSKWFAERGRRGPAISSTPNGDVHAEKTSAASGSSNS